MSEPQEPEHQPVGLDELAEYLGYLEGGLSDRPEWEAAMRDRIEQDPGAPGKIARLTTELDRLLPTPVGVDVPSDMPPEAGAEISLYLARLARARVDGPSTRRARRAWRRGPCFS